MLEWGQAELNSSAQGQRNARASAKSRLGHEELFPGSSEQRSGALAIGTGGPLVGAPSVGAVHRSCPGWLAFLHHAPQAPWQRVLGRRTYAGLRSWMELPGEEAGLRGQTVAGMECSGVVAAPSKCRSLGWFPESSFRKLGLKSESPVLPTAPGFSINLVVLKSAGVASVLCAPETHPTWSPCHACLPADLAT